MVTRFPLLLTFTVSPFTFTRSICGSTFTFCIRSAATRSLPLPTLISHSYAFDLFTVYVTFDSLPVHHGICYLRLHLRDLPSLRLLLLHLFLPAHTRIYVTHLYTRHYAFVTLHFDFRCVDSLRVFPFVRWLILLLLIICGGGCSLRSRSLLRLLFHVTTFHTRLFTYVTRRVHTHHHRCYDSPRTRSVVVHTVLVTLLFPVTLRRYATGHSPGTFTTFPPTAHLRPTYIAFGGEFPTTHLTIPAVALNVPCSRLISSFPAFPHVRWSIHVPDFVTHTFVYSLPVLLHTGPVGQTLQFSIPHTYDFYPFPVALRPHRYTRTTHTTLFYRTPILHTVAGYLSGFCVLLPRLWFYVTPLLRRFYTTLRFLTYVRSLRFRFLVTWPLHTCRLRFRFVLLPHCRTFAL